MKVIVLLSTDNNKLFIQYKGQYTVKAKLYRFEYRVEVNGREEIYHANLLKRYIDIENENSTEPDEDENSQT